MKSKIIFAFAIILTVSLGVSSITKAATTTPPADKKGFCAKLVEKEFNVQNRISNRTEQLEKFRNNQEENITKQRTKRDEQTEKLREKWEENRDKQLAKILERATTTDAQKQAAETFKKAVNDALTAKKTALDAANKIYRDGVDAFLKERKDAFGKVYATYKDSVKAAMEKAKTDCANSVDQKTIKTALANSVKQAWQKFTDKRKTIDKIQAKITALRKTYQDSAQTARNAFQKAVNDARDAFKKSLKTK